MYTGSPDFECGCPGPSDLSRMKLGRLFVFIGLGTYDVLWRRRWKEGSAGTRCGIWRVDGWWDDGFGLSFKSR
jgi:hypothetical protein